MRGAACGCAEVGPPARGRPCGACDWELYVGHNEIYARHGKGFLQDDLAEHFSQCGWYVRLYTPEEYDALPSLLNEYEQANSDLMWEVRNERGI